MTTCIAVHEPGVGSWLAADRRFLVADKMAARPLDACKISQPRAWLALASSGNAYAIRLMRSPKLWSDLELNGSTVTTVRDSVARVSDRLHQLVPDMDAVWLFATPWGCGRLWSDGDVAWGAHGVAHSIGSGCQVAMGAWHALRQGLHGPEPKWPPHLILRRCIEIAAMEDHGTGDGADVVSVTHGQG